MSAQPDWDAIAAEVGLPTDWREQGFDSPEYMVSEDSIYRQDNGVLLCVWPNCEFRRRDVEAMFRHVHDPKRHHREGSA